MAAVDRTADNSAYNVVLTQDPRIVALNATQTSITQAGPFPGSAVPQQDTDAVVVMSGDMAAATSLELRAVKAGMPGCTSSAAGLAWRYTGDTSWRGHDAPVAISGFEPVVVWDAATSTNTPTHPHLLTLPSGAVLMVYADAVTVPSASDVIRCMRRDPSTEAWGAAVVVHDRGGSYSVDREAYPCLCLLPSGRVLCFFYEELASGDIQIGQKYSDDEGATWTRGARNVLPDMIDYAATGGTEAQTSILRRFRVAYVNGDIVMFLWRTSSDNTAGASNTRELIVQYASSDLGCTFTEVTAPAVGEDDYNGVLPDVCSDGTRAWFVYHSYGGGVIHLVTLSSAYEAFDATTAVPLLTPGATFSAIGGGGTGDEWSGSGDVAVCLDDVGIVWVYEGIAGTKVVAGGAFNVTYSDDAGASVSTDTPGIGKWFTSGDAETYPINLACCFQRGRVLMAHQWESNPGNDGNSIAIAYLGGYSTATLPLSTTTGVNPTWRQKCYLYTWLPYDEPQDTIWTLAGAGADTLLNGYMRITTAATARTYSYVPTTTMAQGLIVRGRVDVVTGSALSTEVHCLVRVEDGVNEYEVTLRFGTAAIQVYDNNAAAAVGSTTIDTTGGVDFIVALKGASVVTYFRIATNASDHEWTVGPTSTTLTDAGATAAGNLIQWGQALSTAESNWYELHFCAGSGSGGTGEQMTGRTYPQDLHPRHAGASAFDIDAGTKVAVVDGPAYVDDQWISATAYRFGFDRCAPWTRQQSPRIKWRTTGTTAQTIDFDMDDTLTSASRSGNALFGVAFFGCNWRTGTIYTRSAAGAYSSAATINAASLMDSCRYARAGNTVYSGTPGGGDTTPYLFLSEANGWTVDLGGGKLRRVTQCYEGRFSDAGGKLATLVLDGVDDTEGASGACKLIPRNFAVLFQINTTAVRGLRIVIDSQSTVDGWLETGQIVIGPAVVHGLRASWGRSVDIEPNEEIVQTRDGQRIVRVNGPHRRAFNFGWLDGIDTTGAYKDQAPDYFATSTTGGTPASASVHDVAQQMEGLTLLSSGARDLLVYMPRVPRGPSDARTLNRRDQLALVNLVSPVAIEVVQGDEVRDEVQRVAVVTMEEAV